jgi:hypothetical protein
MATRKQRGEGVGGPSILFKCTCPVAKLLPLGLLLKVYHLSVEPQANHQCFSIWAFRVILGDKEALDVQKFLPEQLEGWSCVWLGKDFEGDRLGGRAGVWNLVRGVIGRQVNESEVQVERFILKTQLEASRLY